VFYGFSGIWLILLAGHFSKFKGKKLNSVKIHGLSFVIFSLLALYTSSFFASLFSIPTLVIIVIVIIWGLLLGLHVFVHKKFCKNCPGCPQQTQNVEQKTFQPEQQQPQLYQQQPIYQQQEPIYQQQIQQLYPQQQLYQQQQQQQIQPIYKTPIYQPEIQSIYQQPINENIPVPQKLVQQNTTTL